MADLSMFWQQSFENFLIFQQIFLFKKIALLEHSSIRPAASVFFTITTALPLAIVINIKRATL